MKGKILLYLNLLPLIWETEMLSKCRKIMEKMRGSWIDPNSCLNDLSNSPSSLHSLNFGSISGQPQQTLQIQNFFWMLCKISEKEDTCMNVFWEISGFVNLTNVLLFKVCYFQSHRVGFRPGLAAARRPWVLFLRNECWTPTYVVWCSGVLHAWRSRLGLNPQRWREEFHLRNS